MVLILDSLDVNYQNTDGAATQDFAAAPKAGDAPTKKDRNEINRRESTNQGSAQR